MRRLIPVLLLFSTLFFALATVPALAGGDVLKTYKSRFKKDAFLSEREAVIHELAEAGEAKALDGLLHCIDVARKEKDVRLKEADKLRDKLVPVTKKYQEKYRKYADQQAKQGNPNPKTHPAWPIRLELDKLEADLKHTENLAAEWRGLIDLARWEHGNLIAGLPAEDQMEIKAKWENGPLSDRDWVVRADQWDLVGRIPTAWALEMVQAAVKSEPDPRVLVHVIDGFAEREPATVMGPLREVLKDVRWVVRAAVVAVLEKTPVKESVDTLVAQIQLEDGRIIDDCARALATLTGERFGASPVQWKNWWEKNAAEWTGPPEPVVKSDGEDGEEDEPDPDAALYEDDDDKSGQTGFFGIDTRSKRLVYVIDVSGSMNEKAGKAGKGDATRAEKAKEELKRAVLGLEDGSTFNIVFFSADVRIWKKEMVTADAETRSEAAAYVDQVAVVGGTATYDALKAAFDLGDVGKGKKRGADPDGDSLVDTIILLSDGKPSIGHTTNPDQIRSDVVDWNKARRIAVHTVAFGSDADVKFMEGLATDTGGTHVAK